MKYDSEKHVSGYNVSYLIWHFFLIQLILASEVATLMDAVIKEPANRMMDLATVMPSVTTMEIAAMILRK